MVKKIDFVHKFENSNGVDLSAKKIFEALFEHSDFWKSYHEKINDEHIIVTDWISNEKLKQLDRMCFYSMIEEKNSNSNSSSTRCIEKQNSRKIDGDDIISVESTVTPENPTTSSLFSIVISFLIKTPSTVEIHANLECKKKIWGVSSMVENMLETHVKAQLETFISLADEKIKEIQSTPPPQSQNRYSNQTPSNDSNNNNRHRKRNHIRRIGSQSVVKLSTIKRVVNGTEKLAALLSGLSSNISTTNNLDHLNDMNNNNLEQVVIVAGNSQSNSQRSENNNSDSPDLDDKNIKSAQQQSQQQCSTPPTRRFKPCYAFAFFLFALLFALYWIISYNES